MNAKKPTTKMPIVIVETGVPQPQRPQEDRLIRLPEVLRIIPISRSKMYQDIKTGNFPAPDKYGARISVWRYSVIHALSRDICR